LLTRHLRTAKFSRKHDIGFPPQPIPSGFSMIEDFLRAFGQTFSPPLRKILLKTVALSALLLLVLGVIMQAVITNLFSLPPPFEMALAIATGLGLIAGAIYLMGPISSLLGALFVDDVASEVERTEFPADKPGRPLPIAQSMMLSLKFFGLVLLVNFLALLLLLIPGINLIVFFAANGYLLGREYFELAAMRYRSVEETKALRRENSVRIFIAGLIIAVILIVPVLNFITPVLATAFMVRVHKRLGPSREILPRS
jgi:CysZ protein